MKTEMKATLHTHTRESKTKAEKTKAWTAYARKEEEREWTHAGRKTRTGPTRRGGCANRRNAVSSAGAAVGVLVPAEGLKPCSTFCLIIMNVVLIVEAMGVMYKYKTYQYD